MFKSATDNERFFSEVEFEAKYIRDTAIAASKDIQSTLRLMSPAWHATHATTMASTLARDLCDWLTSAPH